MILQSERLRVEIAEPGIFPANTFRFDRCGFVTSIKLDEKHEFCTMEPTNLVHPSTGGVGLCNEYLCSALCDEVKPGEKFVKFGIGAFTRPDEEPYCFFRKYEIEQFPMRYKANDKEVIFYTDPDKNMKDQVEQTKRILVDGSDLVMEVELKNVGEREIVMEEFCHNFLTIDGLRIGPKYQLHVPYLNHTKGMGAGTFYGKENGVFSFHDYNAKAALLRVSGDKINTDAKQYEWTLSNEDSPAMIRCLDEFCPSRLEVWSIDHIISVETFYGIYIKPGEKTSWKRRWKFELKEG